MSIEKPEFVIIPSSPIEDQKLRHNTLKFITDLAPKTRPLIAEFSQISDMTHALNVATAYQNFIINFINTPGTHIPPDKAAYFLNQGTISALFHDIGKLGIDPEGMAQSYKIFHFEEDQPKLINLDESNISRKDQIPEKIKAQHKLHPLIGGYMLEFAGLNNAAHTAFSHHEILPDKNEPVFKSSYPRINGMRDTYSDLVFMHTIIELMDTTIAMRENRYGRPALDFSIIETELNSRINGEISKRIKPYLPNDLPPNEIKKFIIDAALKTTRSLDPEINKPFIPNGQDRLIDQKNLSYEHQQKLFPVLTSLIKKTWETHGERLIETYNKYLETEFVHLSRQ